LKFSSPARSGRSGSGPVTHRDRLRASDRVLTWRRGARVIARRRATRDARATLSRGETRRSEKLASRDAQRARTRRDRATDARENVNRIAPRRRFAASRACFRLATRDGRCARGIARRNASIEKARVARDRARGTRGAHRATRVDDEYVLGSDDARDRSGARARRDDGAIERCDDAALAIARVEAGFVSLSRRRRARDVERRRRRLQAHYWRQVQNRRVS